MDTAKSGPAGVESILLLENNVVIAQDLVECLHELNPCAAIAVARTEAEALERLSDPAHFHLAIVPHGARRSDTLFAALSHRVKFIALHGKLRRESPEDPKLLYLDSPFSSETVASLYSSITSCADRVRQTHPQETR